MPIAKESWSSGTTISIVLSSSIIFVNKTLAGLIALHTYLTGSGDHSTTSIFSFLSSSEIVDILAPLTPIHAPTGSILEFLEYTATFALSPGSLAAPLTSIIPSNTSGISASNNFLRKLLREHYSRNILLSL